MLVVMVSESVAAKFTGLPNLSAREMLIPVLTLASVTLAASTADDVM